MIGMLTEGIGIIIPKVKLNHTPTVSTIPIDSDRALQAVSDERNLALNPNDIPTIRRYFLQDSVQEQRRQRRIVRSYRPGTGVYFPGPQ